MYVPCTWNSFLSISLVKISGDVAFIIGVAMCCIAFINRSLYLTLVVGCQYVHCDCKLEISDMMIYHCELQSLKYLLLNDYLPTRFL